MIIKKSCHYHDIINLISLNFSQASKTSSQSKMFRSKSLKTKKTSSKKTFISSQTQSEHKHQQVMFKDTKHSALKQSAAVTRATSAFKITKQVQSSMSQHSFQLFSSDSIFKHLASAALMSMTQTKFSQMISFHAKLTSSFIVRNQKLKSEFTTVFNLQQCQKQQSTD